MTTHPLADIAQALVTVADALVNYANQPDTNPHQPAEPISLPIEVDEPAPTKPALYNPYIKHAGYIAAVQTAHEDWRTALFLPSRHKDALTVSAIKEATGLAGQQTACDVRKLLVHLAQITV